MFDLIQVNIDVIDRKIQCSRLNIVNFELLFTWKNRRRNMIRDMWYDIINCEKEIE